jgi:propionyl-CoA carboxylase alpha chain
MPSGPGVRVDSGVEAGERVPPEYDPLIAKVLVVDASREAAIGRLQRALDEVEITGIQTTLPFHRFVARHAGFRGGELSTDWVADEWEPQAALDRDRALRIGAQAAAAAAGGEIEAGPVLGGAAARSTPTADPAAAPSAWRDAGRAHSTDRWPR